MSNKQSNMKLTKKLIPQLKTKSFQTQDLINIKNLNINSSNNSSFDSTDKRHHHSTQNTLTYLKKENSNKNDNINNTSSGNDLDNGCCDIKSNKVSTTNVTNTNSYREINNSNKKKKIMISRNYSKRNIKNKEEGNDESSDKEKTSKPRSKMNNLDSDNISIESDKKNIDLSLVKEGNLNAFISFSNENKLYTTNSKLVKNNFYELSNRSLNNKYDNENNKELDDDGSLNKSKNINFRNPFIHDVYKINDKQEFENANNSIIKQTSPTKTNTYTGLKNIILDNISSLYLPEYNEMKAKEDLIKYLNNSKKDYFLSQEYPKENENMSYSNSNNNSNNYNNNDSFLIKGHKSVKSSVTSYNNPLSHINVNSKTQSLNSNSNIINNNVNTNNMMKYNNLYLNLTNQSNNPVNNNNKTIIKNNPQITPNSKYVNSNINNKINFHSFSSKNLNYYNSASSTTNSNINNTIINDYNNENSKATTNKANTITNKNPNISNIINSNTNNTTLCINNKKRSQNNFVNKTNIALTSKNSKKPLIQFSLKHFFKTKIRKIENDDNTGRDGKEKEKEVVNKIILNNSSILSNNENNVNDVINGGLSVPNYFSSSNYLGNEGATDTNIINNNDNITPVSKKSSHVINKDLNHLSNDYNNINSTIENTQINNNSENISQTQSINSLKKNINIDELTSYNLSKNSLNALNTRVDINKNNYNPINILNKEAKDKLVSYKINQSYNTSYPNKSSIINSIKESKNKKSFIPKKSLNLDLSIINNNSNVCKKENNDNLNNNNASASTSNYSSKYSIKNKIHNNKSKETTIKAKNTTRLSSKLNNNNIIDDNSYPNTLYLSDSYNSFNTNANLLSHIRNEVNTNINTFTNNSICIKTHNNSNNINVQNYNCSKSPSLSSNINILNNFSLTNAEIKNTSNNRNLINTNTHQSPVNNNNTLTSISKSNNNALKISSFLNTENIPINPSYVNQVFNNYEKTKTSHKSLGIIKAYAVNTHNGTVRTYNEDRVAIVLSILKPIEFEGNWPLCSVFAIYDGHGGSGCANFLRDNLHNEIFKDSNFTEDPVSAIKRAFLNLETQFTSKAVELSSSSNGNVSEKNNDLLLDKSGSCALVMIIVENRIFIANLGDSRAIMSLNKGEKIIQITNDHKPGNESEMRRIICNGGKVYQTLTKISNNEFIEKKIEYCSIDNPDNINNMDNNNSCKEENNLIFPLSTAIKHPPLVIDINSSSNTSTNANNLNISKSSSFSSKKEIEHIHTILGPHRILPGRLSISRSFGDVHAKLPQFGGMSNVLIAEPEVLEITYSDKIDFILLGCDGIYDHLSNEEIVKAIWMTTKKEFLSENIHSQSSLAIDMILKTSMIRKSSDNVTSVFVAFEGFESIFANTNNNKTCDDTSKISKMIAGNGVDGRKETELKNKRKNSSCLYGLENKRNKKILKSNKNLNTLNTMNKNANLNNNNIPSTTCIPCNNNTNVENLNTLSNNNYYSNCNSSTKNNNSKDPNITNIQQKINQQSIFASNNAINTYLSNTNTVLNGSEAKKLSKQIPKIKVTSNRKEIKAVSNSNNYEVGFKSNRSVKENNVHNNNIYKTSSYYTYSSNNKNLPKSSKRKESNASLININITPNALDIINNDKIESKNDQNNANKDIDVSEDNKSRYFSNKNVLSACCFDKIDKYENDSFENDKLEITEKLNFNFCINKEEELTKNSINYKNNSQDEDKNKNKDLQGYDYKDNSNNILTSKQSNRSLNTAMPIASSNIKEIVINSKTPKKDRKNIGIISNSYKANINIKSNNKKELQCTNEKSNYKAEKIITKVKEKNSLKSINSKTSILNRLKENYDNKNDLKKSTTKNNSKSQVKNLKETINTKSRESLFINNSISKNSKVNKNNTKSTSQLNSNFNTMSSVNISPLNKAINNARNVNNSNSSNSSINTNIENFYFKSKNNNKRYIRHSNTFSMTFSSPDNVNSNKENNSTNIIELNLSKRNHSGLKHKAKTIIENNLNLMNNNSNNEKTNKKEKLSNSRIIISNNISNKANNAKGNYHKTNNFSINNAKKEKDKENKINNSIIITSVPNNTDNHLSKFINSDSINSTAHSQQGPLKINSNRSNSNKKAIHKTVFSSNISKSKNKQKVSSNIHTTLNLSGFNSKNINSNNSLISKTTFSTTGYLKSHRKEASLSKTAENSSNCISNKEKNRMIMMNATMYKTNRNREICINNKNYNDSFVCSYTSEEKNTNYYNNSNVNTNKNIQKRDSTMSSVSSLSRSGNHFNSLSVRNSNRINSLKGSSNSNNSNFNNIKSDSIACTANSINNTNVANNANNNTDSNVHSISNKKSLMSNSIKKEVLFLYLKNNNTISTGSINDDITSQNHNRVNSNIHGINNNPLL